MQYNIGAMEELEEHLWERAQEEWPSVARAHRWEFQVLRWCMADPGLRTQALRFIDCLPSLSDPRDVVRHLREYFPGQVLRPPVGRMHLPAPLRLGLAAAGSALFTARAAAAATRHTASSIARLFIAGAGLEEAAGPIRRMEEAGYGVTVDLLGEATVSRAEADQYAERYVELIRGWKRLLSSPPHVSLKLSSLAYPFDPVDPEGALRQIAPRFGRIFQAALAGGGFVNIDMEQRHLRDLTLELAQRLLEEEFPDQTALGVVVQAYLKDSEQVTRRLLEWAKRVRPGITVRLVRGAYWDTEVIWSRQRSWPCPVYTRKEETDASFDRLAALLLEHHKVVKVAIGTHNTRSLARAIALARRLNIPPGRWECQMLYGMSEPLQRAVLAEGAPLRIYTPVGELIPGMAYLVRRILENTSQYSFFAMGLQHAE